MCNCCKSCKVPCITVTGPDVALGGSTTVITVPPFEGAIPPCGRVDLCLPPIFPCNNLSPVQINNGTVVYETITKCGNVLRTDQLSGHCCKFALHLRHPSDTLTYLDGHLFMVLDKLCPSRHIPGDCPSSPPAESAAVSAVTAKSTSGKSAA